MDALSTYTRLSLILGASTAAYWDALKSLVAGTIDSDAFGAQIVRLLTATGDARVFTLHNELIKEILGDAGAKQLDSQTIKQASDSRTTSTNSYFPTDVSLLHVANHAPSLAAPDGIDAARSLSESAKLITSGSSQVTPSFAKLRAIVFIVAQESGLTRSFYIAN